MAATATMELGGERTVLSASEDLPLLSEKLAELKGLCMARLTDFLLCHNSPSDAAAAADDPLLQDDADAGSEDEEADDANGNPSKKRK